MAPTVEHFRYCFLTRRQTIAGGQQATCDSVTFNYRQGDWYPKILYNESFKHWTSTFFYCKDIPAPNKEVGIPTFFNGPPTYQLFWTEKVMKGLPKAHRLSLRQLEFLTKTMEPRLLDIVETIICWLSRKIMPLHHHPLKMCEYKVESTDIDNGLVPEETLMSELKELI